MQITEIRWATGYPGKEAQRYRMPLRYGVTFIHDKPGEKLGSPFPRLQMDLIYPPDDSFEPGEKPSRDYWQFIFRKKDLFYSYSTDQATPERDQFFRRAIVGCEGEILGSRINYAALSDRSEPAAAKKEQLELLLARLDESRRHLHDRSAGQGKITSLQSEIMQCALEIKQQKEQAGTWPGFQQTIDKTEKQIAGLKAEDQRLAGEQRRLKQLMVKSEFETLTELQRELDETMEREGIFGSRITEKGHNITVHEMTRLSALRKEVADFEQEARSVEELLESTKAERIKAEQERILTERQLRDLDQEKSALLDQVNQVEARGRKETDRPEEGHASPTRKQLGWLAALLVLACGFLLFLFNRVAGAVLTGLGLLSLLTLGLANLRLKHFSGIRFPGAYRDQEQLNLLSSDIQQLSARIAEKTIGLDRLENYIGELDDREVQLLAEAGATGRKFRRAEHELMRLIRQYAGPSESTEADDIITTLSRQRESSAHDNEMVADLQRRIADLAYGRSQAEMLREYQDACRELGQADAAEMTGLRERAQEISKERVDLAAAIDELEGDLSENKKQLGSSRESTVTLGGLERKYEALSELYQSTLHDYLCINGAVAWLKDLLSQWKDMDFISWMALSAGYLHRLTGRRPGGLPVSLPGASPRDRLRAPKLPGGAPAVSQAEWSDSSVFLSAPQSVRYLAVRLGLVAAQIKSGLTATPLFLLEPAIPSGYTQGENILNTLEEWSMETRQQIVYFSRDRQLIAIARAREMNLYYLR